MTILTGVDKWIVEFDRALRVITHDLKPSTRPSPAESMEEAPLSREEKKLIAGLMRVNHAGEVCAQALYQGQALTAKLDQVRDQMEQAAIEEWDHLAWCEQRLTEVGSHTSYLNPLWYFGSLTIGAVAGWIGDRWSLAFVSETENQVIQHLENHLDQLPAEDKKSRAILNQMQIEEAHHGQLAKAAGAAEFPQWVKWLMNRVSKLMTKTTYYC